MKKVLALFLALLLTAISFTACKSGDSSGSATPPPAAAPTPTPEPAKPFKAAILLPGSASDVGFSGPAYQGMLRLQDELGIEISYSENVEPADYETIFRGYAEEGYNIIFGHGNQFTETALKVAAEFPDTWFAITSANEGNGTNLAAMNSAPMTCASGRRAVRADDHIQPRRQHRGLRDPAPDRRGGRHPGGRGLRQPGRRGGQCLHRRRRRRQVQRGGPGPHRLRLRHPHPERGHRLHRRHQRLHREASTTLPPGDYAPQAPQTVLASVMVDNAAAIFETGKLAFECKLEPIVYDFGIKQGAVTMTGYGALEDKIPAEVKAKMASIIQDIKDGKLDTASLFN